MRKDTRIIIGICFIFLLAAGFLFVKQQEHISGVTGELVTAKGQEDLLETSVESDILQDSTKKEDDKTIEEYAVYVSGAVKHPGLYRYRGTARVSDAIDAVGGFLKTADWETINLARILTDGEQICVLTKKEAAKQKKLVSQTAGISNRKEQEKQYININKASLEELMTLPGIGQAKASLIIEYRRAQGNFSKTEDLMKISGIKEGVYNKIKDLISV